MISTKQIIISILAASFLGGQLAEAAIRTVTGKTIDGTAVGATKEGLEVQKAGGSTTIYPWAQLSPATRYRHDEVYRANYQSVLDGEPPSERTKKPIVTSGDDTAETEPEPEESDSTEKKSAASDTLRIFDNLVYENINPISVNAFPGLELRTPSLATYWGLQYGPGHNEIVYLAFDTPKIGEPHDIMYIYVPNHEEYGTPVQVRGTKRRDGALRVANFKKFRLDAQFGRAAAEFGIEFTYSGNQADAMSVLVDGRLEADGEVSTFTLYDEPNDLIRADGIIRVRGIVDLPVLWLGLESESATPRLAGSLKMSRMNMLPRQGMDTRVTVTFTDSNDTIVHEDKVRLGDGEITEEHALFVDVDKLTPGEKYKVEAEVDLGAFLGTVKFRRNITMPGG